MPPEINLGGRLVGRLHVPLVIAELGINHGGDLQTALALVAAAAQAGVEVVKHQTHIIDDEMAAVARRVIPGNANVSIYDIMQRCALSEDEELHLKHAVEEKGMIFVSTPFSRAAADRLAAFGVCAFKIGSGECNNYPLLRHICNFGKPILLSTGMNTIASIAKAVAIIEENQLPYALLHTTNIYPTPPHLVRLGAMVQLEATFPRAVIGLSDHTTSNYACLGAVALGASVVERHFTDTMLREGPDISCSMDVTACRELINGTKILFRELGGVKAPVPEEQQTIAFAFATVTTIAPIKKGEPFSRSNIWVKRPGLGEVPAADFDDLLGRTAARDIPQDTQIMSADIYHDD